jgi:hypothetical protein
MSANHLEHGTKYSLSTELMLGEKFHGCGVLYGIEEAVS